MTATIVDGRAIANNIKEDLRAEIEKKGVAPRLDIVVVGEDPVTTTFVNAKKRFAKAIGVDFKVHSLSDTSSTEEIISLIKEIAPKTNGLVVQLPLPEKVNTAAVLVEIPTEKDIDILSENTFGRFVVKNTNFFPPVAGAVQKILETHKVTLSGIKAVIIGRGRLVGAPVRTMFEHEGADITILDSKTSKKVSKEALKAAEIIVSGVGVPDLVRKEHISKGVILIDAGTSSSGGSVMGDICLSCVEDAKLVSKTPGGVGPITVAILFRNLVHATYST